MNNQGTLAVKLFIGNMVGAVISKTVALDLAKFLQFKNKDTNKSENFNYVTTVKNNRDTYCECFYNVFGGCIFCTSIYSL